MQEIIISVIIPMYNAELFIEDCLKSLLIQGFLKYEVIIVNDGSTDHSVEICENLIGNDKRFKIITKEGGGVSSARNVGIRNCLGDYICFIDADDIVHKDYLATLYRVIKQNEADLVIAKYQEFNKKENINFHIVNLYNRVSAITKVEAQKKIYSSEYIRMCVLWNKIFRRTIFDNINFPEGRINEDEYVIHVLFDNCNKIMLLDETLYYYRIQEKSIMHSYTFERTLNLIQILENRAVFYEKYDDLQLLYLNNKRYCNCLFGFINMYKENVEVSRQEISSIEKKIISNYNDFLSNPYIDVVRKIMIYFFINHKKIYHYLYSILRLFRRIINEK